MTDDILNIDWTSFGLLDLSPTLLALQADDEDTRKNALETLEYTFIYKDENPDNFLPLEVTLKNDAIIVVVKYILHLLSSGRCHSTFGILSFLISLYRRVTSSSLSPVLNGRALVLQKTIKTSSDLFRTISLSGSYAEQQLAEELLNLLYS